MLDCISVADCASARRNRGLIVRVPGIEDRRAANGALAVFEKPQGQHADDECLNSVGRKIVSE